MPLEPVSQMMRRAREGGYAVGYFESWDLASLQGVIDAAEQSRSPVIVGFSGEFLSRPGRLATERLRLYGALGQAAAETAQVPCALIFNECPHDEWTFEAIAAGFNLVMPSPGADSPGDYRRRTREVVRQAHAAGVAVEAELGELPYGGAGSVDHAHASVTDPADAERFVRETGVDLLAVSVGNVHILLQGERGLDLNRLEQLRRQVPVPLVLHGGSGIDPGSLGEAIRRGVAKVNYGTCLKRPYLAAVRAAVTAPVDNPHRVLGLGDREDMFLAGRRAVRDAVLERIPHLGCSGRS